MVLQRLDHRVAHFACAHARRAFAPDVGGAQALGQHLFDGGLDAFGGGCCASEKRSIMAALRMVASGFAMPLPAMSGALPWLGSYRPWPCR